MSKLLKKLFHKHKYECIGFTFCANGFVALHGECIEIYECKKCGKRILGDMRRMTKEEIDIFAKRYEKHFKESMKSE